MNIDINSLTDPDLVSHNLCHMHEICVFGKFIISHDKCDASLLGMLLNTDDFFKPLLHCFLIQITTITILAIYIFKKYFKYYLNWIRQIHLGSS